MCLLKVDVILFEFSDLIGVGLIYLGGIRLVHLFPLLLEQQPQPFSHLGVVPADWGHGGGSVAKYLRVIGSQRLDREKLETKHGLLMNDFVDRPLASQ